MKTPALVLPDELAAQVLLAAARAYPNECCGLIEGTEAGQGWIATAVHEAANIADNPARHFLIDPQAQFDLLRAMRGQDTQIIGCFHSHPDGEPAPSATDRAEAYEPGFLYVIAGGSAEIGLSLRAYRFDGPSGFTPLELLEA